MAMIKTCKAPDLQTKSASGSVASFDTILTKPLEECTSLITGYQEGTGTPSPQNKMPLHAFSSASLGKTGKNLFDKNNSNQILNAYFSGGSISIIVESSFTKIIYIKCKPNTTYTLSRLAGKRFDLGYTKVLPSLNVRVYDKISRNTASSITITTGADAQYLVSYIFNSTVDTSTLSDLLDSIQIEENDEATAYEPFGNTYTFTFGQSIYQGSIDWKRGVVVGLWTIKKLRDYSWELVSSGESPYFRTTIPDYKYLSSNSNVLAEIYSQATIGATGSNEGFNIISIKQLRIRDLRYNDANAFVNGVGNVQLAYELETPIEIPLGGINLLTQQGQNNIFADTGDIDLTYKDLDIAKRGNFREVFKLP